MTSVKARPRRSVRSEIMLLASVLAVPAALFAVFPRGAVDFVPAADAPGRAATCAFVKLADGQVAAATEQAHAAWRVSASGVRGLRADLYAMDLPEEEHVCVTDVAERTRPPAPGQVRYDAPPMPPTMAAPPPAKIAPPAAGGGGALAFPRKELLRIE